jgi:SOS-response transcriptional repressor LexA
MGKLKLPLTKKQRKIYDYIKMTLKEKQRNPTCEEMSGFMGVKQFAIYQIIDRIAKKGWIIKKKGTHDGFFLASKLMQENWHPNNKDKEIEKEYIKELLFNLTIKDFADDKI